MHRRHRAQALASLAIVLLAVLGLGAVAVATPFSLSGSMEGALKIDPGDWVAAGYHFKVGGAAAGGDYSFPGAGVTLPVSCTSGGSATGSIVVPLRSGPWTVAAGNTSYVPWSDQGAPASYQGSVQAPDLCGGKTMYSTSATFAADARATDTNDPISVQFHYRVPAAKGQGNVNCADGVQHAASVCGAGVSSTSTLTPSASSPSPTTTTSPPPPSPPTTSGASGGTGSTGTTGTTVPTTSSATTPTTAVGSSTSPSGDSNGGPGTAGPRGPSQQSATAAPSAAGGEPNNVGVLASSPSAGSITAARSGASAGGTGASGASGSGGSAQVEAFSLTRPSPGPAALGSAAPAAASIRVVRGGGRALSGWDRFLLVVLFLLLVALIAGFVRLARRAWRAA
jgi:hypothetical protein